MSAPSERASERATCVSNLFFGARTVRYRKQRPGPFKNAIHYADEKRAIGHAGLDRGLGFVKPAMEEQRGSEGSSSAGRLCWREEERESLAK